MLIVHYLQKKISEKYKMCKNLFINKKEYRQILWNRDDKKKRDKKFCHTAQPYLDLKQLVCNIYLFNIFFMLFVAISLK